MADIGTMEWARRGGGRLTLREKLAQLRDAVVLQFQVLRPQLRWQLGLGNDGAIIDISAIALPDSTIARRALEHCREVSPPALVNHCLRTYLWGQSLAVRCGVRPDAELLWAASLLHDLGLTERYADGGEGGHCFAVRGALAAGALARDCGWPADRAEMLAEAISLHLNVVVGVEYGVEALLLNAATALDVTGLRIWELHETTVRAVVDRHPRLQFKNELAPRWHQEANAHPDSRAHFLSQWLGFERRIRTAPFIE